MSEADPPDPASTFYSVKRPSYHAASRYRMSGQKIAGHVTYQGASSQRRVALYHRGSGVQLDLTYSRASDGYFEFRGLEPSEQYFVVGFDDVPGAINAEVSDHVVPE